MTLRPRRPTPHPMQTTTTAAGSVVLIRIRLNLESTPLLAAKQACQNAFVSSRNPSTRLWDLRSRATCRQNLSPKSPRTCSSNSRHLALTVQRRFLLHKQRIVLLLHHRHRQYTNQYRSRRPPSLVRHPQYRTGSSPHRPRISTRITLTTHLHSRNQGFSLERRIVLKSHAAPFGKLRRATSMTEELRPRSVRAASPARRGPRVPLGYQQRRK